MQDLQFNFKIRGLFLHFRATQKHFLIQHVNQMHHSLIIQISDVTILELNLVKFRHKMLIWLCLRTGDGLG